MERRCGPTNSSCQRPIRACGNRFPTRSRSRLTDDGVFLVPGREPFGKEAFAVASQAMTGLRIEGTSDIRELTVLGDWAYVRSYLEVTMTPAAGKPMRRAGYTLSILRKGMD